VAANESEFIVVLTLPGLDQFCSLNTKGTKSGFKVKNNANFDAKLPQVLRKAIENTTKTGARVLTRLKIAGP
jgi:hypothetical protein